MNQTLADKARAAIQDTDFDCIPHHCERFAREVLQSVYGDRYDDVYCATARLTAFAWQQTGLGKTIEAAGGVAGLQPGDLLYKTEGDGPDGHVGIFVGSPEGVAENSSTPIGRTRGACGFRTLAQWGHIDVAVRLPDPDRSCAIALSGRIIVPDAPVENGVTWCPVRAWAQAMGFRCDWNEKAQTVSFDDQPSKAALRFIGGHAYASIRDLAQSAGLCAKALGTGVSVGRP